MIRFYTKEDIPSIVKLEEKNLHTTLGYDRMIADLDNSLSYYYIYEENNQILGCISLIFDGFAAEILNFCIDESIQNQGKGTYFLASILDIFYNKKATNIILDVRKDNLRAIHVYEKLGFTKIRERKGYYSDGMDALVLQRMFIPVFDVEDIYFKCFGKIEFTKDYIQYSDEIQKDKYFHNFYRMKENSLKCVDELTNKAGSFVQFHFSKKMDLPNYEFEDILYLHSNIHKLQFKRKNSGIVRKFTEKDDKVLYTFLFEDALRYGRSYSENNAKRMVDMALYQKKVEYYGIWLENKLIGCIHSFMFQQALKVESFVILDEYQRQGHGSTLLSYVIEQAKEKGVQDVFLCADNLDTPKEMYKVMGFDIVEEEFVYRRILKNG